MSGSPAPVAGFLSRGFGRWDSLISRGMPTVWREAQGLEGAGKTALFGVGPRHASLGLLEGQEGQNSYRQGETEPNACT